MVKNKFSTGGRERHIIIYTIGWPTIEKTDYLNILKAHNARGVPSIYPTIPAKLAESTRSGREMDPDPAAILAAVADPPTQALLCNNDDERFQLSRVCTVYVLSFIRTLPTTSSPSRSAIAGPSSSLDRFPPPSSISKTGPAWRHSKDMILVQSLQGALTASFQIWEATVTDTYNIIREVTHTETTIWIHYIHSQLWLLTELDWSAIPA